MSALKGIYIKMNDSAEIIMKRHHHHLVMLFGQDEIIFFQSGHPSFLFPHLYDALAIEIVHFLYKKKRPAGRFYLVRSIFNPSSSSLSMNRLHRF